MVKNIIILSFILAITSCVSQEKKLIKKYGEQPDWAKKSPISNTYYYGVGISNKSYNNYQQLAVKNALDNLSNEISVEISSSSLLSTLETETSFQQEYSQSIQTYSKAQLEGYETVDSWENDNAYFVCYRLSKALYKELKAKKIKNAIELAEKNYLAAKDYQKNNNFKQAVINNIQGLEALSPFFDEALTTIINGKEINLPIEIINSIKNIEKDLILTPSFTKKNFKIGEVLNSTELYVNITDLNNNKIPNIPVLFDYFTIISQKEKTFSDGNGTAAFNLGKIKSEKQHQEISVSIDFKSFIEDNSNNRIVKKVINYQNPNKVILILNVTPPSIFIKGTETLDGKLFQPTYNIKSVISTAVIDQNFEIVNDEKKADLVITFEINSTPLSGTSRLLIISTSGTINILEQGRIIYSKIISAEKGTHLSQEEAINEAYKRIIPEIKNRIIPQFKNQYYGY